MGNLAKSTSHSSGARELTGYTGGVGSVRPISSAKKNSGHGSAWTKTIGIQSSIPFTDPSGPRFNPWFAFSWPTPISEGILSMFRKTRLYTPGPTPLLPAAQFAMAAADLHHRTPEFRALYKKVIEQLKLFIGTQNDVVVLASSGTGAMEAAVSNLTSPGDEVLVLTAGKFGERWTSLAKAFGCNAKVVSVPYGQTFTAEQVRSQLSPKTRAVYVQATETSTGARHDVAQIGAMLKGGEALLVVDAITGLGTTAIDMEEAGIDVIIGGSQKALMIPPGLAYLAASEPAWKRMETTKQPRYYFDLQKERKSVAKGESAYTPAVALIAAMGAALTTSHPRAKATL